jgi:tetratricopeptide (TPR) repeat protein
MKSFSKFLMIGSVVAGCFGLACMGGNLTAHAESAPAPPVSLAPAPTEQPPMMPVMPPLSPPMAGPTPLSPEAAAAPAPMAPPAGMADKKEAKNSKSNMQVQPANILPLPKDYLIVKKEHGANELISSLTAARMALARNQNGAALELFNGMYAKYPKDGRVLIGRAVAMQRLAQNGEALSAYEEALKNDPKNLEALTNMLGLLNSQHNTLAMEKLQQLAEVYPFNADIAAQLGMAYGGAGEYEQSLKYLDMADALKPGNADILYNRAVVYDKMGKTEKAADLYSQIVSLAGDGSIDQSLPIESIKKRLATIR